MTDRLGARFRDARWVAAWTLAGLALRAVLIGFTNRITGDGVGWYVPMARAFLQRRWEDGFDAYIPPVYSLTVAAVAKYLPVAAFTGPAQDAGAFELAGQIASALHGAATIPLVYLLARRVATRDVARVAAALAAVSPFMARFSARVMSESAYTFFFVLALLAGFRLLRARSIRAAAVFGLATGVACLNRPEAMGLLAVFGGWIGIPALTRRKGIAKALGLGAVVGAFFLAGAFPQIAITHAKTGAWTLSAKGGQIFKSSRTTDPLEREKWLYPAPKPKGGGESKREVESFGLLETVREDGPEFAGTYLANLGKLLAHLPGVTGFVLTAFALAGIAWRREVPRGEDERVALSVPAAYLLLLSLFHPAERFLIPLVPAILCFSAIGIVEAAARAARGEPAALASRLPRAARGGVAWWLVAAVLLTLPEALAPVRESGFSWYWSPEKRAGVWMRAHLPPGAKVMTRGSYIEAYYAGARVAYFPYAPYDEVMRYARRADVRYFLLDDTKTRRLRPGFLERVERTGDARLVRRFPMRDDTVSLYEVTPRDPKLSS
jgi:hypothetical protein